MFSEPILRVHHYTNVPVIAGIPPVALVKAEQQGVYCWVGCEHGAGCGLQCPLFDSRETESQATCIAQQQMLEITSQDRI